VVDHRHELHESEPIGSWGPRIRFIGARMRLHPKVVVGSWHDTEVHAEIGTWVRAAWCLARCAAFEGRALRRHMRNVAVTEGDKVEAEIRMCYSVNGYGVGDLVQRVQQVTDAEVEKLTTGYDEAYAVVEPLRAGGCRRQAMREAARIELGLRHFLKKAL